ncbi:DNA adenine methylase [Ralstonia solanacearum species complex bacterium KE101]|uniref:site-specific DNA-methyltransferase (adenine-specific) n=1 Tax=Ralstonia solanacearum TaxID=305 RepID=A0A0S4U7E1_RALSL|nr:DNA methyltransferase [Ralstonia pseudosolanacearum]NKA05992.1 DNA methyltransferase [Ralstonia solanacearum]NKA52017.1 DNA methyltransferase [Ralstonia solanacearum]NKA69257.1 DNA methyltransferase [Ralstonia solanacearum]NKA82463.1 DNA methyltransferase [Ralstonia solanacearum]
MYSNRLYTPLRYPGGKARFAPFIGALMEQNGLTGGHYLEPYAGGAGVALDLLFHGVASHIHINDYDRAIFAFWQSATRDTESLIRLIWDTPVTMEQWYHWRNVLRGGVEASELERGFATLFMNRTNRSGILKGGVIGGKAQAGEYTLDARYKKQQLVTRLEKIAAHAGQISVHNEDAISILAGAKHFLPQNSLIYLDPPYYVKGQDLYRNYYEHNDHARIAKLLCGRDFPFRWVVSYDGVDEIRQMYGMVRSRDYDLRYTAQSRYIGSEVMFFSPTLDLGENFPVDRPRLAA